MILADTSTWIDHLSVGVPTFQALLDVRQILIHPMVIGELACGNIRNRDATLKMLSELRTARVADYEYVLALIENRRLMGRGISYIDAHLLASALITESCLLWTRDRRLMAAAEELDVAYRIAEMGASPTP